MDDILFFKVFKNLYICNEIFKHVKLFNKNRCVKFKDLKSLQEYSEKEYINTLIYKGNEMINYGDLPINGNLEHIVLKSIQLREIKGKSIPYGVKSIEYCPNLRALTNDDVINFSTYPSTIETLINFRPSKNETFIQAIPSNIKIIKFSSNIIQSISNETFKNSSNLTELIFGYNFKNGGNILKIGDLPPTLVKLNISGYENKLNENVIPESVTDLSVSINEEDSNDGEVKKNIIPNNVKKLHIILRSKNLKITSESLPCSIKDLQINFYPSSKLEYGSIPNNVENLQFCGCYFNISAESNNIFTNENNLNIKSMFLEYRSSEPIEKGKLPQSITELKIADYDLPLFVGTIPNSVTSLIFLSYSNFNSPINQHGILPPNLENLQINENYKHFILMINYLPKSLKSISLPNNFKNDKKIKLPLHINKIEYREMNEYI